MAGLSYLIRFLETVCVFYFFLLAFYFKILILYTADINPRINKDIIIIIAIIIIIIIMIIIIIIIIINVIIIIIIIIASIYETLCLY